MKNLLSIGFTLFSLFLFGQAPQGLNYQAVVRGANGQPVVGGTQVVFRFTIHDLTPNGSSVFTEDVTETANQFGICATVIGNTGNLAVVNWGIGHKFLQVEVKVSPASTFADMGTTQLQSVPYALFSANATVGGFTHYLGEAFNGGIIYYLYKSTDGLEHGLIVALTETLAQWQSPSSLVLANRSWDGAYNTNVMTNSPAKNYIATLGAGWYLPSIDELGKLYYNRFETNKALFAGGHALISSGDYWSSSEATASNALLFAFVGGYTGSAGSYAKTSTVKVRGVRAF